jgi:chemotaxis protein MotB
MSNGQEDVSSQPLVIVRRRRNTEEGHHGGVWKIAYADFMTAMMAFFLVMWLINAADKKTIVQVAAYFNPIRLTDRNMLPKGLDDLTEADAREKISKEDNSKKAGKKKEGAAAKQTKTGGGAGAAGGNEAQKEAALFENPGQLLNDLEKEAQAKQAMAGAPAEGNISDPFDRVNRQAGKSQYTKQPAAQPEPIAPAAETKILKTVTPPVGSAGKDVTQGARQLTGKDEKPAARTLTGPDEKPAAVAAVGAQEQPSGPAVQKAPNETQAKPAVPETSKQELADAKAKTLQTDIGKALAELKTMLPNVEVTATSEGMLVSLLDDANFGMFDIGSAKPSPELVLVMDKIGDVLKGEPGDIVIRGHTDSRAYKGRGYDNWRLSAARAQMAYYMLRHGGLPEARFTAIEGRADRDPKVPSDTTAAQNRRIDILIKEDQK